MKVNIGPYPRYVGPYQIAEKILFWRDKDTDNSVYNFGRWLSEDRNGKDSLLLKLCQFIHSKRQCKVKIKIDNYDTWGMDSTLAMIILPMLIQLKNTKHGVGFIDNADVPDSLKDETNYYSEAKYSWFLDELIWAFSYLENESNKDYNLEEQKRVDNALTLFGKYFRTLWD